MLSKMWRLLSVMALLSYAVCPVMYGQDTAPDQQSTDQKTVPESIADMQKQLQSLGSRAKVATLKPSERVEQLAGLLVQAEELSGKAVTEVDQRALVLARVQILLGLISLKSARSEEKLEELISGLQAQEDKSLYRIARLKCLEVELSKPGTPLDRTIAKLKDHQKLLDEASFSEKMGVMATIVQLANSALPAQQKAAAELLEGYVADLKTVTDPKAERLLASAEGVLRRLQLPGQEMVLTAEKTITGESFDWAAYKGKVVLVDFWATWCGPCVAEFPRMTKFYETYHPHGFEIVGISVDSNRKALDQFLEKKPLPWTIVHDHQEGEGSPNARYYSINSIPRMILIGRNFEVISINARGQALEEQLKKDFPGVELPVEKEPESEAVTDKSSDKP
ncbi:alkyl hydroperoxide reductase/ Thiol specific antioxidant/ Mal allergen [Planctopirus limnophila DSM 3776]|uniref:Alkyl hydroperoxide reductase/ Thiol specific antioxidant/ Mal allergen n=2 Tax=Planctopirus limnophila TaxID=120 RepID=D5SSX2_PLAL2|nr:alkyl hydroperoxide reductase/ Thiol specific antioxidant/ Mal allergen [Planctopirus limnophila DSM 3776]